MGFNLRNMNNTLLFKVANSCLKKLVDSWQGKKDKHVFSPIASSTAFHINPTINGRESKHKKLTLSVLPIVIICILATSFGGFSISAQINANIRDSSLARGITLLNPYITTQKFVEKIDAEPLCEGKNAFCVKMSGKKIVIPNGIKAYIKNQNDSSVYCANNSKNLIKKTLPAKYAPCLGGVRLVEHANNCVHLYGTATTSNNISFFWGGEYFDAVQADAMPIWTYSGKPIYVSVFCQFKVPSNVRATIFNGASNMSTAAIIQQIDISEDFPYAEFTISDLTAGDKLTIALGEGDSEQHVGRTKDVEIYIFVSENKEDILHPVAESELDLYRDQDALILSDQIISLAVVRKNDPLINDMLDVCAYNVQNFITDESSGYDEAQNKFIESFTEMGSAIILLSEWQQMFSPEKTFDAAFTGLRDYWGSYNGMTRGSTNNQIGSQYRILYECCKDFVGANETVHRNFYDCVISSNKGNVHIIVTHLQFRSHLGRLAEIQQIIDYVRDNGFEYVVIGGDFNNGLSTEDPDKPVTWQDRVDMINEDLDAWTNNGFISAQRNVWGDARYYNFINTGTNLIDAAPVKAYDNIIVSDNIQMLNIKTISHGESDHLAIYAELKME